MTCVFCALVGTGSGAALIHCSSTGEIQSSGERGAGDGGTDSDARSSADSGDEDPVILEQSDAGPPAMVGPPPSGFEIPPLHRASAYPCATQRGEAPAMDGGPYKSVYGKCVSDTECTAGTNGRCDNAYNSMACECDYDQCDSDDACGGSAVCACRNDATERAPNICLHSGNCRLDADCRGGYCSPTRLIGDTCDGRNQAYYCSTVKDECTTDAQCGDLGQACLYSPHGEGYWACVQLEVCDSGLSPGCGGP